MRAALRTATPIRIRELTASDRDAVRAVFVASRDAAFVWNPPGSHRLEDFDAATAGEVVLVARIDGAPVGFASVWVPDSFLHNLFVHPAFQRRGVGSALLEACTPHFSATATLKCLRQNRSALRFYRARGWSVRSKGADAGGAYLVLARDIAAR